jgi:hypothetical protein
VKAHSPSPSVVRWKEPPVGGPSSPAVITSADVLAARRAVGAQVVAIARVDPNAIDAAVLNADPIGVLREGHAVDPPAGQQSRAGHGPPGARAVGVLVAAAGVDQRPTPCPTAPAQIERSYPIGLGAPPLIFVRSCGQTDSTTTASITAVTVT